MKSVSKILLLVLLILSISLTLFACTENEIDYKNIQSITVDEQSIEDGFLLSEFDISKIILNVQYQDVQDEKGNIIPGEVVQIPADMSMVVAEDKAQLSVPGTKTITLRYGKFDIAFELKLHDDRVKKYKVVFLSQAGEPLGDTQYIAQGGKAIQPTVPNIDGYDFLGWVDRDTNEFSSFDNITKETTLIAHYAAKTFTVNYFTKVINNIKEADGSVGESDNAPKIEQIATAKVARGESALDKAPSIPVIEGYSNGRWENIEAMENISSDMNFYAIYDQDSVMITFNYKKRSPSAEDESRYYYVNGYVHEDFDVEQKGFKFVGWFTEAGKAITFPYQVKNEMRFVAKYIDLNEGNQGLSYKENDSGQYIISGFDGEENVVVIPKTYNGIEVVGISPEVFANHDIKEFVVSNDNEHFAVEGGVLYNKAKDRLIAYPNLKSGTSFNIDTTTSVVTSIADYAFMNAKNLVDIDLGDSLVTIGDYAFSNCSKLTSITIPATVTTIGNGVFKMERSSALTELIFAAPSSLKTISDEAFYGLSRLKTIDIPASVESIGSGAFILCKSLQNITVNKDNQHFVVSDSAMRDTNDKAFSAGGLYNADFTTLYCYPANFMQSNKTDIVLPYSLQLIESGAFSHTKIQGIHITSPSITLKEIDSIVSPNLVYLRVDSDTFIYTISSFGNNSPRYVPSNILVKNQQVYDELTADQMLKAENAVISIFEEDKWAELEEFYNNFIYKYETNTVIENGKSVDKTTITILGGRNTTTELIIPDILGEISITKIAPNAFSQDENIVIIRLPIAMEEIGDLAFANMPNLEEIHFNDNLKKIGYRAFFGSDKLSVVEFSNDVDIQSLGVEAFHNTAWYQSEEEDYLTINGLLVKFNGYDITAEIEAGITQIASDAFAGKTNLTSITFTSGVLKTIGFRAFEFCTGLSEIMLPASIEEIESQAFFGCANLQLVTINASKDTANSRNLASDAFPSDTIVRYAESDTYYTLYFVIDEDETRSETGIYFVKPITVEDDANRKFAGWYEDQTFSQLVSFPLALTEQTSGKRIYAKFIEASEGSDGFRYQQSETGYTITGYDGDDNYVIIPQMYKNRRITAIKANAFRDMERIQSINFPYIRDVATGIVSSLITSVGEDAFTGTAWFNNYLGDFVIINDMLIKYKGNASIVEIPSFIKKIADGAFSGNTYIKKVVIPEGVTILGENMFRGCVNLTSVVLASTIESIGDKAFADCVNLTDINFELAQNLLFISSSALNNTAWIARQLDDCIVINSILYKYQGVPGLGSEGKLTIMNGITQIADRAFENDERLKIIQIPKSMQYIGEYAFANSNIDKVLIFPRSDLKAIGKYAFFACANLSEINLVVCNTLDLIGDYAFANTSRLYASDLKALLLPSSIMEMGEGVFENSGVCRVVFEAGSKLKELPKNAFRESHNLSSVIFNDNSALTTIGEYAFYNCTALSVFSNVNARIETIGAGAFYNCIYLYTLDIQDFTLKNIGAEAFNNMGFVNSFNQNMVTVGNILIKYKGRDSIINIPSSITTIYDGAFSGNTQITAINFATDSKLVAINDNAFNDCINLETINFPRGITSVGNNVVTNTLWYENALRSGLEYITIGNTLIKYNGNAKQVVIPEYVTIINKDAFSGVELYNIEIGAHVTMVKAGALNDIITPQTTYEKGRYHYVECLTPESFSDAKQVSINTYGMENLFYMVGDDYIATPTFILGITDYYIFDSSVKAVQGSWSLTLINPMPFDIEENTINEILVASDDAKEDYLLDMRWDRYAEAIKVIKTFAVTLVFDDEIAQAPELMELEMIYEEIAINVINDDYIFIGWYFDETRRNMVQYPLKLNHNITIYAKFVNYEIGTEGGFSRNDENTEITSYNDDYDKVIVIPAFSDYDITAITGYWAEANPPHTYGTHIFDLDQQIFVPEPDEERATHYYLGAFEARNQVEVVYFANNSKITTIGANAFKDCTSLRKIVLPASITLIEQGAFSGCTSLTEIVFTASLDNKLTIESGAFENCVSLRSITLPNNLAALGHNAFSGCINLIDIHMTDTEATTVIDLSGISPFDTNDGKIKIYVNSAVYNIYSTRWSGYKEFLVEVTDEE